VVVFFFFGLFFFIVGTFVTLRLVLFLPLQLTSCQDNRSSFSSLLVPSSASEKSAVGVSALFVGAPWDVLIVYWVVAAYMLLGVVSAVHIKLGVVSGVYERLVAECLIHMGALPFAD
jgi:hypothetical protein